MVDVYGRTLLYLVSFVGLFFFFFSGRNCSLFVCRTEGASREWETDDTGVDGAGSCAHAEGRP